jgi:hypothetical protein
MKLLLGLSRLANFMLGLADVAMVLANAFPDWRHFLRPPLDWAGQSHVVFAMAAWLAALNALIRLHAAVWPHEKVGYRLMCWSWIVEIIWFSAMIATDDKAGKGPELLKDTRLQPIAVSAVALALATAAYRSAIGKSAAQAKGKLS